MSSKLANLGVVIVVLLCLPLDSPRGGQVSIRGVVTDETGHPLASVRVGVIDEESASMRETRTDSSGRFEVEGLDKDRSFRIVASKYGYTAAMLGTVLPGGKDLRMTLHRREPALSESASSPAPSTLATEPQSVESGEIQLAAKLVLLNVTVKEGGGRPVSQLRPSNFSVYADGERQEIAYFEEQNAPLSVVLLIDVSSSMAGAPLQEAKRAALEFIDQNQPQVEVALVAFNDRVRTIRGFTLDRAQLRADIQQLAAGGGTALYDSITKAIESMTAARYARHVVVLLTDGKDEDSSGKFGEVERFMQSQDVIMFAVGEYDRTDRQLFIKGEKYYKQPQLEVNLNPVWVLHRLADVSGGAVYFPSPGESLLPLFRLIARELQDQYVLGFIPPSRTGVPRLHTLDVRVDQSGRPGPFTVRTRQGYIN